MEADRLKIQVAFENEIGMRFVLVPAGTFTMGSPDEEDLHHPDEGPQHLVTISKAYYLSIFETTNGQYRRFRPDHQAPDRFRGDDQPAVRVSHDDAVAFSAWLSNRDRSHRYRLPTEAEWEYACRAGTSTRFSFGDAISMDDANVRTGERTPREATMPVGSLRSNSWGIFDMHGNVQEWCADWEGRYASGPATDPLERSDSGSRVLRGGSFESFDTQARSAWRNGNSHDARSVNFGFRLAVSARTP